MTTCLTVCWTTCWKSVWGVVVFEKKKRKGAVGFEKGQGVVANYANYAIYYGPIMDLIIKDLIMVLIMVLIFT